MTGRPRRESRRRCRGTGHRVGPKSCTRSAFNPAPILPDPGPAYWTVGWRQFGTIAMASGRPGTLIGVPGLRVAVLMGMTSLLARATT